MGRLQPADTAVQWARRREAWAHDGMHGSSVRRRRAPTKTRRRRPAGRSWRAGGGVPRGGPQAIGVERRRFRACGEF
jgi:hypothetical protein